GEGVAVLDATCFMPGEESTAVAQLSVTIANPRTRRREAASRRVGLPVRVGGLANPKGYWLVVIGYW
ncbi:MAG: hypothetical protein C4323_07930, partial [Mastigocladus sp. ERB_26_2]